MLIILNSEQLIEKMKNKGITFNLCSENEAIKFLNEHNYYIKVTAYKSNFFKHNNKYVGLDFKALKDLSTIDMYLKQWILNASLSVEHSLKVNLLKDIQEKNIDEFEIVKNYLKEYPKIIDEIKYRRDTPYVKKLLTKYQHPLYPIWVFFEIIPFGEFVNFYKYYCQKYSYTGFSSNLLYNVRNIRNASAHNNCVIHDLTNKTNYFKLELVKILDKMLTDVKKSTIQDRLGNNSMQDFVSLLIAIDSIIKSQSLKKYYLNNIKNLFHIRMVRDDYLYKSSPALSQMYNFSKKIIDKLYYIYYNENTN